ncbi:MAG TPA: DNA mismatch repair protein MutS [Flavitalea sp.]|nr:DNA mismatch repair protein MutS [Flavitalea sp.]
MEIDNTTYRDLSIFHSEEEYSLFNKLNLTRTAEGKEWLLRLFRAPFSDARRIRETQSVIRLILEKMPEWPDSISNGTLMVIAKFYNSGLGGIPSGKDRFTAFQYKLFHNPDFSLLRYSLTHFADFLRGMQQLVILFDADDTPQVLQSLTLRAKELIGKGIAGDLAARKKEAPFSPVETLHYGRYLRRHFKNSVFELIDIFGRIDAWYAMAAAMKRYQLVFPTLTDAAAQGDAIVGEQEESPRTMNAPEPGSQGQPYLNAHSLYHMLLPEPIPYDVHMNARSNFIFLTGANMAGKSTFIRSVGCAVFMAHLGMGVPAKKMTLSIFDGLLSNINVADNIVKGESYFFNEVQRIKNTILKINDKRKWLVLIDELFKGTNVQDAMKCSSAVIKGLIKISNSLFILSTHLYEIGEELRAYPTISFKYFETEVLDDQLKFSYQLKEGISNDRLGYIILKREKVTELLENL